MKILVIGGSYFYGRVFVMLAAKEHEVTVVNRGTYSVEALGAKQIRGDRKEEGLWKACGGDYDAIVDFCAYEAGDISKVLRNMPGKIKQYIFISTVDVYERGGDGPRDEGTPFETRHFPGEAGNYIAGKVALEQELVEACRQRGMDYTVLRPAVLYGPFNYAPREAAYIQMMVQGHVLPRITDASGSFQCVYVKDAAEAILKCLLNERAYGQAYNLCQDQVLTYDTFLDGLRACGDGNLQEISYTCAEAGQAGIPLPFPLTKEESQLYSNEKGKAELGIRYVDFTEGMARTYRAFEGVYR